MTGVHRDQVIPPNGTSGRPGLVQEYLGTEPRKLAYLAGFLVGVLVLVTIPYVWIVGWDKWKTDMREASHMMWASYTPAADVYVAPAGPAAAAPNMYSVVPAAAPAPVYPAAPGWAAPAAAPAAPVGRQYVCPTCGASGLPAWSAYGQPVCPSCGGLMFVAPVATAAVPAAAP